MTASDPRILVLGGNYGRLSASQPGPEAPFINGVEAWVYALNAEYRRGDDLKPSEVSNFDIIIGNTNLPLLSHHKKYLDAKPSHVQWIALIEGTITDYLKPNPLLNEILNRSDLVATINHYTVDFFRKITTTHVENIGMPHPSEKIRTLATPIDKRRKQVFLGSYPTSRQTDYLVAKELDMEICGYEKRLSRKLRSIRSLWKDYGSLDPDFRINKANALYKDPGITLLPEMPPPGYFRHYGGTYLWINMDERCTWGRNILDAAALQVPIISTRSTGHQEMFFPELLLENPYAISEAVALGKRLVSDEEFYRSVSTVPLELLEPFGPAKMKERLLSLL